MKGSCTYTLSRKLIMRALVLRSRLFITLLLMLAALGGWAWAGWNFYQGLMDEKLFFDWIMGTLMGVMIGMFFIFGFLQIRANTARPLPAGRTTLDWSPSGLAVRSEQEMFTFRWEDVRWRSVKDGFLLSFPNGRFTYVASREVSDADRESLRAALNASVQWSRELRDPSGL